MTIRHAYRAIFASLLLAASAAGDGGIFLTDGSPIDLAGGWQITDGAAQRWVVARDGSAGGGEGTYGPQGAMRLMAGEAAFEGGPAVVSQGGREVQIGPWSHESLRVWRRVYIDGELGFARWIDVFENAGQTVVTTTVEYGTQMAAPVRTGARDDAAWTPNWVFLTSGAPQGAVVFHAIAHPRSERRPEVQIDGDTVRYRVLLQLAPGERRGVCLFQAQRPGVVEALEMLGSFHTAHELRNVSPQLRAILVNMDGPPMALETLEVPRNDDLDRAVLRNGDEVLGTILADRFVLATSYSRLELAAGDVVGLSVPDPDDLYVQIGLADGQVVGGRLEQDRIEMRLEDGNVMSLPLERLVSLAYRVSQERPGEIPLRQPTVLLRSGERLFFQAPDADATFLTEHGPVPLRSGYVHRLDLSLSDIGLHRAIFTCGSQLSGLLEPDRLTLRLELGPELRVRRNAISRLVLDGGHAPTAVPPERSELILRNGDRLVGDLLAETLTLRTASGDVVLRQAQVARIVFATQPYGQATVHWHNGSTVSGRLGEQILGVQLRPGPRLDVAVGHIEELRLPQGLAPADPPQTPEPAEGAQGQQPQSQTQAAATSGPALEDSYWE